jgi:hypothetical protein
MTTKATNIGQVPQDHVNADHAFVIADKIVKKWRYLRGIISAEPQLDRKFHQPGGSHEKLVRASSFSSVGVAIDNRGIFWLCVCRRQMRSRLHYRPCR